MNSLVILEHLGDSIKYQEHQLMVMGLQWDKRWVTALLVLCLSVTLMTLMIEDLQGLGPLAFILDFIVLSLIVIWMRKKKARKALNKWESAFPSE